MRFRVLSLDLCCSDTSVMGRTPDRFSKVIAPREFPEVQSNTWDDKIIRRVEY